MSFSKFNFLLWASLAFSLCLISSQVELLKRHEISEREAHLEDLAADYKKAVEESNQRSKLYLLDYCSYIDHTTPVREKVDARVKNIQERKRTLALARAQLQQEDNTQHDTAAQIAQNR